MTSWPLLIVTREAYIKPCVLPTSEAVSLLTTFEDPSDGFQVSIPLASPPNATAINLPFPSFIREQVEAFRDP